MRTQFQKHDHSVELAYFLTQITQPLHGKADLLNARICPLTELFFYNLSNKSTKKFPSWRMLWHLMCLEYNYIGCYA